MKHLSPQVAKVAAVAGIFLGAFAISVLAGTWTAPTVAAPGGNPDAPLNVGYGVQTKQGGIILNSLDSTAGNPVMNYGLWVVSAPIKAGGGLIIETRTAAQGNPTNPETGRMWLMTP